MLVALKTLCSMNPADRKNPQKGKTMAVEGRNKLNLNVQSQGVKTGERVMITMEPKRYPK